ncbi:MAG: redoxin domain-containing protein, partial [Planctomycetaceae bacterium]|nr:redoxin domain-containing protein [Planctomycetaceae bacterium]
MAFLQAEGKTPEITGTDMNGNPFDWNAYRGKTVLVAFTSSWYGGREMQDMIELSEEFAGQGLEWVTFVKQNGKDYSN